MPTDRFARMLLASSTAVLVAVLTALLLSAVLTPDSSTATLPHPAPPADLPLGVPATGRVPDNQQTSVPAILPSAALYPVGQSVLGTPAARPTSATGTPAPTRTTAPTGRPGKPSPTTPAATVPAQNPTLTATLTVTSSWEDGYVAVMEVVNSGSASLTWTGTVSNASRLNVRLGSAWNAAASQDGGTIRLRGEPLAPGRTITEGFQVSTAAKSYPLPSACTLTGSTCRLA